MVLRGRGFDPEPRANTVTFGRQPALVLSAKANELQAFVPAAAGGELPEIPVVVTTGGRSSQGALAYQLSRAAGTQFRLRFFPDAVPEMPGGDAAFVSTELGPLLLLGGPAEFATTAERAANVASALNALVESASSGVAPALELRAGATPSVAVPGQPRPLVAVTARDVAAYGRVGDGGRPRSVTAAIIARHWNALLQDYLGLFVARQRPVQLLALTSRGRVLSDIYAEAVRRAPGERSVPASVAQNAAASMAQSLRQLALVASGEAPRLAAVVEGRWQGTIEDPDRGPRRFRAQIRSEDGRLAGTMSTWSGAIEVRSPLRDVSFEGGVVRFTASLQGGAHRFQGTLESSRVKGSIEREGKPPLTFTMDYLD